MLSYSSDSECGVNIENLFTVWRKQGINLVFSSAPKELLLFLKILMCSPWIKNSLRFRAHWKDWFVVKSIKRAHRLKATSPDSPGLLQEQRSIVYSSAHWHSTCILIVLSHNQQVAIFMHVKVEGTLFMGDWTRGKRTASSKMVYVESNPLLSAPEFAISQQYCICM